VLKQLFSIFLSTHEAHKAVALSSAVAQTQSRSLRIALANMQVQQLGHQPDLSSLSQLAERYPQAIRPRFALAKWALAKQDTATAQGAIVSILKQKPQWSADLLPLLSQCQLEPEQWQQLLTQLADKHHNISARLLMTDWLAEHQSVTAAEQYLLQKLQQQPNIRLFQKLLQLRQQQSAMAGEVLESVAGLVNAYLDSKALYSCRSCGFKTRQPYWLCPSCQQWESVEPIAGIDGR
jgi:lipopolysaccharide biosynthesis regulator YciM